MIPILKDTEVQKTINILLLYLMIAQAEMNSRNVRYNEHI